MAIYIYFLTGYVDIGEIAAYAVLFHANNSLACNVETLNIIPEQ